LLARQVLNHFSHASSSFSFFFFFFEIQSHLMPEPALIITFLCFPHKRDERRAPSHLALLGEMGGSH
jgi:hypothetical protein